MENQSKNIQTMFNDIAKSYDVLNRILSFRRDVAWRKKAIKLCNLSNDDKILDLACGTGDMIAEMRKTIPNANIIGGDFSINMLKSAKNKLPNEKLSVADAHYLPFKDNMFDKITISFGFRNVTDKPLGLSEMYRVMKDDATLCILEFSEPENPLFAKIYKLYFTKILPTIGGIISGKRSAYEYLPDSVYKFPKRDEYRKMILDAGFKNVEFTSMTFGIVTAAIITK